MPKTSKSERATRKAAEVSSGSDPAERPGASTGEAEPKKQTKRSSAAKRGGRKTATKKPSTGASVTKQPAKRRASRPAVPTEPSEADIRLRAYFIAERRVQLALQGDPARDWIEARQQLVEEAQASTSSGSA